MDKIKGIHIDVEIPLTDAEYDYQVELFEQTRSERIRKEVHLYFSVRKTIREIAGIIGISKSQVHKDLRRYRDDILRGVKDDIRINSRTLTTLVELTEQAYARMRVLYAKYDELDECVQVLRVGIRRDADRLRCNSNYRIREQDKKIIQARELRILIDSQSNILSKLRCESQQLLSIYETFGLCSPDATALIQTGTGYVEEKIANIKAYMVNIIRIMKEEIKDDDQRKRAFLRMAEDIKERGIVRDESSSEEINANDFRI